MEFKFIPQASVCTVKKSPSKIGFCQKKLETHLLSVLKSSVLILQFFIIFLFSFMFSTNIEYYYIYIYIIHIYITKLRTKVQNWPKTFKYDGTAAFIKDLAMIQETKLQNIDFTRLYSVTVLITFSKEQLLKKYNQSQHICSMVWIPAGMLSLSHDWKPNTKIND